MMQPFCAPRVRMRRVSLRVSMPLMATTPLSFRYCGRLDCARQLLCARGTSLTISPAQNTARDSQSSSVAPVLPICG